MTSAMQKILESAQAISLPEVYFKLKALLDEPGCTMAEVALLLGRDPVLAARFLRFVNSSFYRRVAKIETIGHAISTMGSRQIHDIVLSASVREAFKGMENSVMTMRRFWQRSTYCAMTARQLALEQKATKSERLFTIGLLADIGHLCMYLAIPEKVQQTIVLAKQTKRSLFLVEQEILGFDFAQVGASIIKAWNLPASLQLPIAFQMEPGKAKTFALEAALLHMATVLVQADVEAGVFQEGVFGVDRAAWKVSGLSAEQCLQARQKAAQQYNEVVDGVL